MDQIDPTSRALLTVLAATALVIAVHFLVLEVRRRLDARRWRASADVIDLTFVHEAIRRDQEVARRLAAEGEDLSQEAASHAP